MLFNPRLADSVFFVPTLPAIFFTQLFFGLACFSIVGERERGTYEHVLALPLRPRVVLLGKVLPYVAVAGVWLVAYYGLVARAFDVTVRGSAGVLALATGMFLAASYAIAVLFSAIARNTHQAVYPTVFSVLPSSVISGFMVTTSTMPRAIQIAALTLPATHYVTILRAVVVRGARLADVALPLAAMAAILAVVSAGIWAWYPRRLIVKGRSSRPRGCCWLKAAARVEGRAPPPAASRGFRDRRRAYSQCLKGPGWSVSLQRSVAPPPSSVPRPSPPRSVSAPPRAQRVVAEPAVEVVVAAAADQPIIVVAAEQHVVARAAVELVEAGSADQRVVPAPALQRVVAVLAAEQIVAAPAEEAVTTAAAVDDVARLGADDHVVAVGALTRLVFHAVYGAAVGRWRGEAGILAAEDVVSEYGGEAAEEDRRPARDVEAIRLLRETEAVSVDAQQVGDGVVPRRDVLLGKKQRGREDVVGAARRVEIQPLDPVGMHRRRADAPEEVEAGAGGRDREGLVEVAAVELHRVVAETAVDDVVAVAGFQTNVSSPLPPTMVSLSRPALTNAGSATPARVDRIGALGRVDVESGDGGVGAAHGGRVDDRAARVDGARRRGEGRLAVVVNRVRRPGRFDGQVVHDVPGRVVAQCAVDDVDERAADRVRKVDGREVVEPDRCAADDRDDGCRTTRSRMGTGPRRRRAARRRPSRGCHETPDEYLARSSSTPCRRRRSVRSSSCSTPSTFIVMVATPVMVATLRERSKPVSPSGAMVNVSSRLAPMNWSTSCPEAAVDHVAAVAGVPLDDVGAVAADDDVVTRARDHDRGARDVCQHDGVVLPLLVSMLNEVTAAAGQVTVLASTAIQPAARALAAGVTAVSAGSSIV